MRRAATAAFVAAAFAAAPSSARAAHPCGSAPPELRPTAPLIRGEVAELRYVGFAPLLVTWGDGTRSRPTVRSGRVRHRFRRTGRLTAIVTTPGGRCCNVAHDSCGELPPQRTRFVLRVRG